jgi:transposase
MSMRPVPWPEADPQVAAAIGAIYGSRKTELPLAVTARSRLGEWLHDEVFAAVFGVRGRPGWSPSRLALVTVLQQAENLTDRMAAEAVRARLDWKYLLGLPLQDAGFDHTVLSEFRDKVAGGGLEQAALDALLERLASSGLVKAGGKQRTDSTHVVAAVAALNRLELAGESVRAALEALAAAHPDWTAQVLEAGERAARCGTPLTSWRGAGVEEKAGRARRRLCQGRVRAAGGRVQSFFAGMAGRGPGGAGAARGAAAELHPHGARRRDGGDQAAGEGTGGRRTPARPSADRLPLRHRRAVGGQAGGVLARVQAARHRDLRRPAAVRLRQPRVHTGLRGGSDARGALGPPRRPRSPAWSPQSPPPLPP